MRNIIGTLLLSIPSLVQVNHEIGTEVRAVCLRPEDFLVACLHSIRSTCFTECFCLTHLFYYDSTINTACCLFTKSIANAVVTVETYVVMFLFTVSGDKKNRVGNKVSTKLSVLQCSLADRIGCCVGGGGVGGCSLGKFSENNLASTLPPQSTTPISLFHNPLPATYTPPCQARPTFRESRISFCSWISHRHEVNLLEDVTEMFPLIVEISGFLGD